LLQRFLHAIDSGERTATDLLIECMRRIALTEIDVRAWVEVIPQEPPPGGPLNGIPFGAKDIFETLGLATEYGSPLYEGRKGAYDAAPEVIEGAVWRDPERVDEWAGELAGSEVVVYCVYGHEVGQSTAARLRDAGITARYLAGGIEDWKVAGRPLKAK